MNELNFKNDKYKHTALSLQYVEGATHSPSDAFFLLINGFTLKDLNNLCELIHQKYNISIEDAYKMTQNININTQVKEFILNLAYECIKSGKYLGNNTINNGQINTSSWISHSLYVGEVCANIAGILGLNIDEAKTLGFMHDYGRKSTHKFNHTMNGFETLIDLGWTNEAIGCLTHSFVNGGRCSNNEPAVEGFYVDEQGNPNWNVGTKKDDITLFLESYNYTPYDVILNIADLMATDKGIVTPHIRIKDIADRREFIDPTNRGYFLTDITNVLINFLKMINYDIQEFHYIKATKDTTLEEIQSYFNLVSEHFFKAYKQLSSSDKKKFAV